MKIAILTNDFPPQAKGGSGIIAEIQAVELEKRGHQVKVFCKQINLEGKSRLSRLFFHLRDLRADRNLEAEIRVWKPDVLLTHNLTGLGFGTAPEIKRGGVPWTHVLHDVQMIEPSGKIESANLLQILWRRAWSVARRYAIGSPDVVISPTKWLLDFHQSYGFFSKSICSVIPNPVLFPIAETQGKRENNLLYVGRLDRDKGIDVLLKAWESLGDERPYLVLIGKGSRAGSIKKDSRLAFAGPLEHDRVLDYMQRSSAVIVPSLLWENQPTVILEALISGCRVIASDVGGIPETLGRAGWIFKSGNASDLARAIKSALSEGENIERQAERQRIISVHRVEVAVGELEALLKSNL